ncbi:MAG: hypothetical protein ACLGHT_05285, partial [Acidimicrobiia bacterium]
METASPEAGAGARPTYSCGAGPAFTIDELWAGTDLKDDEPARLLAEHVEENGWAELEWRRVYDGEDAVLFVGGDGAQMPYVLVERADSEWRSAGGGTCAPARIRDGVVSGSWTVSPGSALDPFAQTFTALVRERGCNPGYPPAGRVSEPEVVLTEDAVTVTFFVEEPGERPEACAWHDHHPTEVVVDLGEGLGDRALFDGGTYPPLQR